jgi:hypothetical protein
MPKAKKDIDAELAGKLNILTSGDDHLDSFFIGYNPDGQVKVLPFNHESFYRTDGPVVFTFSMAAAVIELAVPSGAVNTSLGNSVVCVTALTAFTLAAPTNAFNEMKSLVYRIKCTAGDCTATLAANMRQAGGGGTITLKGGKTNYFGFKWNDVDGKWDLVAPPDATGF